MTSLDTNMLVRYIMQDDAKQAAKATKMVEGLSATAPGFIALVGRADWWECTRRGGFRTSAAVR